MSNSKILFDEKSLVTIKNQAIAYWLTLWDEQTGGFRFASHQPATLMATAYSIIGLEFAGGLTRMSSAQKDAAISFLMAGSQSDGTFCDLLFRSEDILSEEHGLDYFREETTTICQQALDALSAPPPPLRDWNSDYRTVNGIVNYLESLSWKNPWLDSNPVMFVLSQLCHDAERCQKPELLNIVNTALDWLDTHQSPETGLWQGEHEVSLTNAMAATFHFTFYYGYLGRPLKYSERIIDSCLSLQQPHGLFSGNAIGQTCLDYDAIDLIAKASLLTNHRADEVQQAMMRAYEALLELQNDDGGFANCKQIMSNPNRGRKAKLLRKLRLTKLLPSPRPVPVKKSYSVCWHLLSCDSAQSNAFSTWFRLLGLHLAAQQQYLNTKLTTTGAFRRLPFLGYHAASSLKVNSVTNKFEKDFAV